MPTHVTLGPEPTRAPKGPKPTSVVQKGIPGPVSGVPTYVTLGPEPTKPPTGPKPQSVIQQTPTKKVYPEGKVEMPSRQRGAPVKQPGMKVLTPEMAEKGMKPQPQTVPKPVDLPPMDKTKAPSAKTVPKPVDLPPIDKAKAPKAPKGKGGWSWLKGLLGKMPKGRGGKAGLIMGAIAAAGAGAYALWRAMQSDWDKYVAMAEEEADKAEDQTAKTIVEQIKRQGEEVEDFLSNAESRGIGPNDASKLAALRSMVDALYSMAPNISPRMEEAASGLVGLVGKFEMDTKSRIDKALAARGITPETESTRKQSLARFFSKYDKGLLNVTDPKQLDSRLKIHLERFVRQMKDRMSQLEGGKDFLQLTRNTLTADNLLNKADRGTMDSLLRVWKSPQTFATPPEEKIYEIRT